MEILKQIRGLKRALKGFGVGVLGLKRAFWGLGGFGEALWEILKQSLRGLQGFRVEGLFRGLGFTGVGV